MSLLEIVVLLIIAGLCGAIAQGLVGFSRGGCILSIVVGFIGALIGSWVARKMQLPEIFAIEIDTTTFPVIWSIIGGVIFTAILSLLTPKNRK